MDQTEGLCQAIGHETSTLTHLCIFKDCRFEQRWCCKTSMQNSMHNHGQLNTNHIIPQSQVQTILQQNITQILQFHQEHLNQNKIQELHQYFIQCEKMNIPIYKRDFEQLQNNIKSNENKLLKYLEMIQDFNIFDLESNQLNEIKNIQYDQSVYDYLLSYNKLKDNVTLKLGRNKIILNYNYSPKQYIIKKIDQGYGMYQCTSISNDERFLAYGLGTSLKIYDIGSNKVIQEKKFPFPLMSCQFSSDSEYLYVGTFKLVMVYNVTNRFKQIFSLYFNSHSIQRIILLKNQQIITCESMKIMKADLKNRKQVFVLRRGSDYITALDYNHFDQLIAVGYSSGSLLFWDCRKMAIIINKSCQKFTFYYIQLINNGNQILCSENIYSFQQVNDGYILLIICRDYFYILNNNGEVLQKVSYLDCLQIFTEPQDQYRFQYETKQLDNLKYVILRSNYKIFLAVAQG